MGYIGAGPTRFNTADELTVTGDAEFNGNLTVKGTTTTIDSVTVQNFDMGDNDRIRIGDSQDLQIYHDGSNSIIDDTGSGRLYLRSDPGVIISKYTGETCAQFNADADVKLYYDNAAKFATTATGVDITGTVVTDGFELNTLAIGGDTFGVVKSANNTAAGFEFLGDSSGTKGARVYYEGNGNLFTIAENTSGTIEPRLVIDDSGNVGIGTSSPTYKLTVEDGTGATRVNVRNTANAGPGSGIFFEVYSGGSVVGNGTIATQSSGDMAFFTGTSSGAEAMRIDSSGQVGIGTSSPASGVSASQCGLNIAHSNAAYISLDNTNTNGHKYTIFSDDNGKLYTYDVDASSFRMVLDGNGNVGIGLTSPEARLDVLGNSDVTAALKIGPNANFGHHFYDSSTNGDLVIKREVSGVQTETMRLTRSGGNLLVGTTDTVPSNNGAGGDAGAAISPDGVFRAARSGNVSLDINRMDTNGDIAAFRKDGSTVGVIGTNGNSRLYIASGDTGIDFEANTDAIRPCSGSGGARDNVIDLGRPDVRFDDIYATNGTIQTSDANEKQQIAELTDAEITAAKAISALFKTFKWNKAVEAKGDAARTHTGVIAQDVQAAMTAAGLDAGDYAFFISSTWWETQTEVPAVEAVEAVYEDVVIPAVLDEDGNEVEAERTEQRTVTEAVEAVAAYTRTDTYETAEEAPEGAVERTRLGIRYPELLAFVGAATEQRLANIETRLTALENA